TGAGGAGTGGTDATIPFDAGPEAAPEASTETGPPDSGVLTCRQRPPRVDAGPPKDAGPAKDAAPPDLGEWANYATHTCDTCPAPAATCDLFAPSNGSFDPATNVLS